MASLHLLSVLPRPVFGSLRKLETPAGQGPNPTDGFAVSPGSMAHSSSGAIPPASYALPKGNDKCVLLSDSELPVISSQSTLLANGTAIGPAGE